MYTIIIINNKYDIYDNIYIYIERERENVYILNSWSHLE